MKQSEGCVDPKNPEFVCKLQITPYGFKQAPRQWYAKINSFQTQKLAFQSSPYDPCLHFFNKNGERRLYLSTSTIFS